MRRVMAMRVLTMGLSVQAMAGCGGDAPREAGKAATAASADSAAARPADAADSATAAASRLPRGPYTPDSMGRVPVFEYHVIRAGPTEFHHPPEALRRDLQVLYDAGYRPVTVAEMHDRRIDQVLPAGYRAFAAVFDDADPTQFSYVESADGTLSIDPNSAVGIWTEFTRTHPGWRNAATFCVLSAGDAGGAFFGRGGIKGQKTEWRYPKMKFLAQQGFEICNHTVWHARLDKYSDAYVQEQIARLQMAVDSAVPGYRVRTLALPLGIWPKTRPLAWAGSWRDPRTGQTVRYAHDAVLEVSGGPSVSPRDPAYDGHSIDRVIAHRDVVERTVRRLEPDGAYVSAGAGR